MPKLEQKDLFPRKKKENPVSYVKKGGDRVYIDIGGKQLTFGIVNGKVKLIGIAEHIRLHNGERKLPANLRRQAFAIAKEKFEKEKEAAI